jgi:hypothetical protein
MRTKDEILKEVGSLAKENPRGGIVPDLADVLMIEALVDIRDILKEIGKVALGLYNDLVHK